MRRERERATMLAYVKFSGTGRTQDGLVHHIIQKSATVPKSLRQGIPKQLNLNLK